jgi:hypothetical protein
MRNLNLVHRNSCFPSPSECVDKFPSTWCVKPERSSGQSKCGDSSVFSVVTTDSSSTIQLIELEFSRGNVLLHEAGKVVDAPNPVNGTRLVDDQ